MYGYFYSVARNMSWQYVCLCLMSINRSSIKIAGIVIHGLWFTDANRLGDGPVKLAVTRTSYTRRIRKIYIILSNNNWSCLGITR